MSIDVHDTVSAGQKAARRARRRAKQTVQAARAIDLHVPDLQVPDFTVSSETKAVAKRAAKKAAKRAAATAGRAAGRRAGKKAKRAGKHGLRRVLVVTVVVGACVAVAVVVNQRRNAGSTDLGSGPAPDPFGAAVGATDSRADVPDMPLDAEPGTDGAAHHEQNAPAAGA